ncbi:hypothetical protein O181_063398 [Austropuccinia psidii MF-1]|uniref:Uncharacterized protein n=1 Tax=Austropuccinia psidii MF-1 TaxID=1389203 RepID=A0A9Q3ELA7_9BASI|nr:hypothetical protein [Austropuccinia psidii MF-1]
MTFPPQFRIKGALFSARKGIPILLLNSYIVQLSKKPIILENNQVYLNLVYFSSYYSNPTVTRQYPSDTYRNRRKQGKRKRNGESLITTKRWTPIDTQSSRKPQIFASIKGKPTLIAFIGKITIIKPVVISKGKFPKEVEKKFLQGIVKVKYPKNIRNQPQDRKGLFINRRPGTEHLGHSGGWQDTEGNHTHSTIHLQIQQKPQTRGLEGYGSSSSSPPTPQRSIPEEHGQQEVQPSITLGRTWSKLPQDMSQRDTLQRSYGNHQRMESQQAVQTSGGEGNWDKGKSSNYPGYRRTIEPDRAYSDSFQLARSRPTQLSSGFTPFRQQQISGQESPFFTILGSFQEKRRIQREKQGFFQPQVERVRPNDTEAVGLGERSTQEPEIVVNISITIFHNHR